MQAEVSRSETVARCKADCTLAYVGLDGVLNLFG
jgi:hypothetical protein